MKITDHFLIYLHTGVPGPDGRDHLYPTVGKPIIFVNGFNINDVTWEDVPESARLTHVSFWRAATFVIADELEAVAVVQAGDRFTIRRRDCELRVTVDGQSLL